MPPKEKPSLYSYIDNELMRNGVRPEDATPEMRRAAKHVSFGLLYGMPPALASQRLGRILRGEQDTPPLRMDRGGNITITDHVTGRWNGRNPQQANVPFPDLDYRDAELRVMAYADYARQDDTSVMVSVQQDKYGNIISQTIIIPPAPQVPRPRRLLDLED